MLSGQRPDISQIGIPFMKFCDVPTLESDDSSSVNGLDDDDSIPTLLAPDGDSGVRIELDFASSSPRKLEEWIASNRIEHDKCDFHVEELEDEFHEEENWWWITTNGH